MAGRAERGDIRRPHVLHLVDEQGDADGQVGGHGRGVGQQFRQVDLQVAGVSTPADGGHVDAELGRERPLRRGRIPRRERLEHAQEVIDPVRGTVPWRKLAHGHVQCPGDRPPDRLLRPCLDLAGAPELPHRHRPERVQQHGLAHAAQPGQDHAALRATARDTLEHDLELPDLAITACQLRRPLSGTRCVGVAYGVHVIAAYDAI